MDSINQAFREIDRANFMSGKVKKFAGDDRSLPIGFDQTISQPTTVRMMLEWLSPLPGQIILDVGSGSGWTTALLAHIVGPKGHIYAVERIPELVEFGTENFKRTGLKNATFFLAGQNYGLAEHAPYDRILVSASANAIPKDLIDQLKPGGKMIIPVKYDIIELTKTAADKWESIAHPGFIFVPLIGQ